MTEQFCRKLVGEYLGEGAFEEKNRFPYAQIDRYRTDNIVELCIAFSLNARQMHEFFRITAHALSSDKQPDTTLLWGWQIGAFFMTVLSIKNRALYHEIGRREISLAKFTASIKELRLSDIEGDHISFWWAGLLYWGTFSDLPLDKLEQAFTELGVWDSSGQKEGAFKSELGELGGAFGRAGRGRAQVFSKIYQTLEGLRTFA
jgi:hypothetical protein